MSEMVERVAKNLHRIYGEGDSWEGASNDERAKWRSVVTDVLYAVRRLTPDQIEAGAKEIERADLGSDLNWFSMWLPAVQPCVDAVIDAALKENADG